MNQQYFEIAHRIKIIHNTFAWNGNRSLEKYHLTVAQVEIMLYLMQNPEKTIYQKEIEGIFRLSNPTVTGILSRLEEKEMITRQVDDKDRRYRVVALSSKGEQALQEMGGQFQRAEKKLFGCLSEAEASQLLGLLDKVTANLSCGHKEQAAHSCDGVHSCAAEAISCDTLKHDTTIAQE